MRNFFVSKKIIFGLIAFLAALELFVVFPRITHGVRGLFYKGEIQAYAFGGYRDPRGALQPLSFLFWHNPKAEFYELWECRGSELCEWPNDFFLVQGSPRVLAHEKLLLFETQDLASERTYRIAGRKSGKNEPTVMSPEIKSTMRSQPTEFKPSWISVDFIEKEIGKSTVRIPGFTWNVQERAENHFFFIHEGQEVTFAFVPSGDAWRAGESEGISYSLFPIFPQKRIPLFTESAAERFEAWFFAADEGRFVRYIARGMLK